MKSEVLNQFKHENKKKNYVRKDHTTAVNITEEHKKLLKKHGINLSKFVRSQLDALFELKSKLGGE